MSAHKNGATKPNPTQPAIPVNASPQPGHRESQVAAVVNVTGDLHIDDGTMLLAVAHQNLTLNDGGGSVFVAGQDFALTNGGAGAMVAGRDFVLRNGGTGFAVAGRDLSISNGESTVAVAGEQAIATAYNSALIAARTVTLHESRAGVIVAGNVTLNGNAKIAIEITPERVAGAIVGLVFYLPVRLLQQLIKQ